MVRMEDGRRETKIVVVGNTGVAQASWAKDAGFLSWGLAHMAGILGLRPLGKKREDVHGAPLEVHGAVGQIVLSANVADLLSLHSLKFGAVSDPMTQAPAEGTTTLSSNVQHGFVPAVQHL